jgi:hypothetical protein
LVGLLALPAHAAEQYAVGEHIIECSDGCVSFPIEEAKPRWVNDPAVDCDASGCELYPPRHTIFVEHLGDPGAVDYLRSIRHGDLAAELERLGYIPSR